MTLLERLDQFPPSVCRLRACKTSTRALAAKAGLKRSTVDKIAKQATWAGIAVDVADKFARACGIDLLATKRAKETLKRRTWKFLVALPSRKRGMVNRLLTISAGAAKQAV